MAARNELPFSEYDDRDEATRQFETYAEIEWLRFELGRKPWWTKLTFRDLFGVLPDPVLASLTPQPASDALQRWVRRRDNAFKRRKKAEEGR